MKALVKIELIVVHCSVSDWGDADRIRAWHTDPKKEGGPFDDIGYHFVILNGFRTPNQLLYVPSDDGLVEPGRSVEFAGAHEPKVNSRSLSICLIGDRLFTQKQLILSLPKLAANLCLQHNLSWRDVLGHNEFTDKKTCPNLDMELVRQSVSDEIQMHE